MRFSRLDFMNAPKLSPPKRDEQSLHDVDHLKSSAAVSNVR